MGTERVYRHRLLNINIMIFVLFICVFLAGATATKSVLGRVYKPFVCFRRAKASAAAATCL